MRSLSGKMDMEQIARRLRVSKTAVHYAIRNTGRLSERTRKRILKAVNEVGYRPSALARSFRRSRADTVGVVVVSLSNSFHAHLLEGVEDVSRQNQHTTLVACSHGNCKVEAELTEVFTGQGVEGLIIVPCHPTENRDYYRGLINRGIKLVFVDREIPGLTADIVTTDHEQGGYLEAHHLIKQGRKRFIYIATRTLRHRSSSVRQRIQGVNRALREAGLEPAMVLGTDPPNITVHEQYGYEVMRHFLRDAPGTFDAVCCAHDGLAYGVIRALTETGLRVPEQVAVVGFDDQDPSAYFQPPLTTVRQPTREIGLEAARLLFRRLEESGRTVKPQRIVLEPTLIVRESSGAMLRTQS